MKLSVVSKSGKEICQIECDGTVEDLKKKYQKERKVDIERQYFNVWRDGKKAEALKSEIPKDVTTVVFKDLGLQISWRMVYFIEYLGPLSAFPITYLLRPYIWGADAVKPLSEVQMFVLFIFNTKVSLLQSLFFTSSKEN
jgi:very-long-chain enoyl-CoA reductase